MKSYIEIKGLYDLRRWEPSRHSDAVKRVLQQYLEKMEPLNKLKARLLGSDVTGIVLHPDGRIETQLSEDCKEAIKEIDRLQAYFLKTLVTDELEKLDLKEGGSSE